MVLGLILSHAGVKVTVLEKHSDFLRDFRGDTVHTPTVRLMDELGLGERFRRLPPNRLGDLVAPRNLSRLPWMDLGVVHHRT
jgi:2-polyprenyl-6-methoxyphenol hydroxylase-like FAD-dependent oxidoreductase